jgi:diadenosine tetraphosphate (Ap4A) HIT family hydrolase
MSIPCRIENRKKPVRQYDSEKLDKEVSELALKLKENPKTFRMLIRTGEDGTKIYRMIGMHVIVNPQGDEVFLPDEI